MVSFALVQMVIEVAAVVVLVILFLFVSGLFPATLDSPIGYTLSNVLLACLIFGLLLLASRWLEHRPLSEIGLPGHHAGRQLLCGFLLGSCLIGSVIGVMALAGFYRITGIERMNANQLFLFLASLLLMLASAVQEELVFRGMLFRLLERTLGSWIAVILSAIAFGAVHLANPNATLVSALAIALTAGVITAAIYMLTRSLWWAIGIHLGWNLFEGPIFGAQLSGKTTPVLFHAAITGPQAWTGGAFGPEAGLVTIIIVGSVGLILCVLAAHKTPAITEIEASQGEGGSSEAAGTEPAVS